MEINAENFVGQHVFIGRCGNCHSVFIDERKRRWCSAKCREQVRERKRYAKKKAEAAS